MFIYILDFISLVLLSFVLELSNREINIFVSDFRIKHCDWSMHITCGRFVYRFFDLALIFPLGGIYLHWFFYFHFNYILLFTTYLYFPVLLYLYNLNRLILIANLTNLNLLLTNFLNILNILFFILIILISNSIIFIAVKI